MPFHCLPFLKFLFFMLNVDLNEISAVIITAYGSEHCSECFYIDSHSVLGVNRFTDEGTGAQGLYRKEGSAGT